MLCNRSMTWKLKRTAQCKKCPWRVDVDPHDIPNGYCETKHAGLASTIAKPADLESLTADSMHVMACHETHDAHCIGWLSNQLGVGNNIALRLRARTCENIEKMRVVGAQHPNFEATLPKKQGD